MDYIFKKLNSIRPEDVEILFPESSNDYNQGTLSQSGKIIPADFLRSLLIRESAHSSIFLMEFPFQFECRKDEKLLGLYYGAVDRTDPNYLFIIVSIYGKDNQNSKSWLYSSEYGEAFRNFITESGFAGITALYRAPSAMESHNENQRLTNQNGYSLWEDLEGPSNDLRFLKLTI